ncbi:MAG: DNA polymerase III subunit delta [Thermoflexia bacterium]|nr:MAG: DNA polymerase III subunit delta [Thermoflexia bacterium]
MLPTTPRFYVFYGTDEFTRSETVTELRRRMVELGELNTVFLDGRTVTLDELRNACETLPFFADRRLIVVTGLLARLGRGRERPLLEGVLRLLQNLPPTTRLVLVEDEDLPDDHPILALAREREEGYVRRFEIPSQEALPEWIRQRAKKHGGAIDPRAAASLAELVGQDLRLLDQEIQKLVTYAGGRPVSVEDVAQLVPYVRQVVIFDLTDALGQRRGKEAVALLHRLLDSGENPMGIMGMIVRHFRLLIQTRDLRERGENAATVARILNLYPFVARKLYDQSANFTLKQLEQVYRYLLDLDIAIKTGELTPEAALDLLVAGVG